MRLIIKVIFSFLLIFLIGCSGGKKLAEVQTVKIGKKEFQMPAGVDSSIAYNSKIKAERLFVDTKREKVADSLNKYFDDYRKLTEELYTLLENKIEEFKKVRLEFRELTESFDTQNPLTLEQRRKYEKNFEQIAEDSLTISIVTSLLDYYLNYCSEHFEQAYELNPFELNILINKSICDYDRGLIFKDTLSYHSSVQSLLKVLDYNKGAGHVYREIGRNFFELGDWKRAHEYLLEAHKIYLITSIFDNPKPDTSDRFKKGNIPSHVDPDEYYKYLYIKGRAEIKVYEADSALATLEKALYLAPSKGDSSFIKQLVKEYIKWDDGNIYAAEQKIIIEDSVIHGNFEWAKNAYIRLLPQVKTKKARDNITFRLARVEFSNLNQPEAAANRFYNLVMNADTSNKKTNIYKAPDDSLYKVYFKDCGTVLFGLGTKYMNEGFLDKAKQYFVKDTTFEWSGKGSVFLPLAQLVTRDVPENLPPVERLNMLNEKRLNLLNRAKDFINNYTEREIDQLYGSLSIIYQTQRNQSMLQRNFSEWNEVKARRKKSASQ